MLEYFTNEVVKSTTDNSAGTLLNEIAIGNIVNSIIECGNLSKDYVDKF